MLNFRSDFDLAIEDQSRLTADRATGDFGDSGAVAADLSDHGLADADLSRRLAKIGSAEGAFP
ncbi:MAG: hypothetical protein ACREF8_02250, partial [Chthoniobacterales bacterium]